MPPSPLALVKWSTELAESLGKPTSAKFIYDWVKASGGELPSGAELKRLSTAVDQGFNTVGYRFSDNAARDEEHLQKMLFEPKRLADENRAFHVDITPGAPAARARAFNVTNNYNAFEPGYTGIRPLALRLENLVNGSDKQANTTRFLTDALNRKASGVRYTPIEGELAGPGRDTESAIYDLAKRSGSAYQPSVAIVDPTAVRDLRSAKFQSLSKPALMAAVALGTTPLLQAKESLVNNPEQMTHKKFVPGANPLVQIPRGFVAGTASLAREGEDLARMFAKYISAPGSIAENWGNRESVLPTNKFFRDELPFKDEGVGADELQTLGSLAGGVGLPSLAKLTAKYAPKIALAAAEAGPVGRSAQRGIIKKPGGNWLSDQPGDSLKGLMKAENLDNPEQAKALNQFINNKLAQYVKNDMATERDPVRALAERGILHVPYEGLNFQTRMHGKHMQPGQTAVGKSDAAKTWEGASDMKIASSKAGEYLSGDYDALLKKDPWLAKVPPETDVHAISEAHLAPDLGFDHLIDELRNATNPASGLPADLLWKYEALDRVSVPQAVERVAKINAWREAQKVEANAAKANNAATVLHKDYPEQGMKWVELKSPEALPDGWKQKANGDFIMPDGKITSTGPSERSLQDALRYEGDTMGNCVGGYCDKVMGGESRVFSLRDSKGQPHVTIEVEPGDQFASRDRLMELPTEEYQKISKRAEELLASGDYGDDLNAALTFATNESLGPPPSRVLQIKGSGKKDNRQRIRMANTGYADNPDAHLVPYIQDFVKSGKWSDVRDLEHSGMQKWNGRYLTREDIDTLSPDELDAFASRNVDKPGFADGGSVYSPDRVDEIVTQHRNSEYDPARVDALVAKLKEEMYG